MGGSGEGGSGVRCRDADHPLAEIVFDLQAGKELGADGEKEVGLQLAKNRHGAAGMNVKLSFNGALQRFKSKEEWGVYANT